MNNISRVNVIENGWILNVDIFSKPLPKLQVFGDLISSYFIFIGFKISYCFLIVFAHVSDGFNFNLKAAPRCHLSIDRPSASKIKQCLLVATRWRKSHMDIVHLSE